MSVTGYPFDGYDGTDESFEKLLHGGTNILDKTRACQQCRARKPCRLFDYGDVSEWLCYGKDSCYEWAESGRGAVKQSCPQGLTDADLDNLLGSRRNKFNKWMIGQTMSICDGRRYNHELKMYEPTECADSPHGVVAYSWDVERFLAGLPVID